MCISSNTISVCARAHVCSVCAVCVCVYAHNHNRQSLTYSLLRSVRTSGCSIVNKSLALQNSSCSARLFPAFHSCGMNKPHIISYHKMEICKESKDTVKFKQTDNSPEHVRICLTQNNTGCSVSFSIQTHHSNLRISTQGHVILNGSRGHHMIFTILLIIR